MDLLNEQLNIKESLKYIPPKKRFTFLSFQFPKLTRIDKSENQSIRLYETPDGNRYPSVTTITGQHGKQSIIEWRKRVGNAEANKIQSHTSGRGTLIHGWCETYLKNDGFTYDLNNLKHCEFAEDMQNFLPYLEKIDNIIALETPMFSHELQCAGSVDCIGTYDNKMSVIDFKTASRPKQKDYIQNYFMQTAAYAHMFFEITKQKIRQTKLLILVDGGEVQEFTENPEAHLEMFRFYREKYRKERNI